MKKVLKILLFTSMFLISGCSTNNDKNILKELEQKINKANSYYLEGVMEIINHEDTYEYDVKVSYQKQDYYKIELVNKLNNHEQVILRNDDGVYVITPSLNKSFKFQSDWPYNNSQVYLLNSIIDDLKEDEKREFIKKDNGYIFKSKVNYPNNKSLIKQNVYINNKGKITKTEVTDKDGNAQIVMKFTTQELNKKFPKNYFELNSILEMNTKNQDTTTPKKEVQNNNTEEKAEDNKPQQEENKEQTKQTTNINDIVYPMYLPNNTYLTNKEKVTTKDGERLILTFTGDSSFILVEEVNKIENENIVIPVSGEFDFLTDVIGVIGTHSLSWHSNGIDYYLASEAIETSELIDIARSINVLPVSK